MVKLTKVEVEQLCRYVDTRIEEVKYLVEKVESKNLKRSYEKQLQTLEGIRSKFQSELKG